MQRVAPARISSGTKRLSSFTLVELLVVIAIIAILVAITLQAASGVMAAAARSRARSEIQAMTTALESYKTDNGAYPQASFLNTNSPAYTSTDGSSAGGLYVQSSQVIYQALSGQINFRDPPVAGTKSYMSFKIGQLGNTTTPANTASSASTATYVADPWGYSYGYSTGSASGASTTNYPYNGSGFYDLWSTGGALQTSSTFTNGWISNWQ